jgi:hypothetical protein
MLRRLQPVDLELDLGRRAAGDRKGRAGRDQADEECLMNASAFSASKGDRAQRRLALSGTVGDGFSVGNRPGERFGLTARRLRLGARRQTTPD